MADLFENYWWLLFPLGFFLFMGWASFMSYKQTKAKIDLLKTYAAAGKEPPATLVESLDKIESRDHADWHDKDDGSGAGGNAFLVVLFVGLGAVFAYEGYAGILGMGEVAYFVSMIMGVMAAAFLVGGIFKSGKKSD
ncbi:hypothetical protein [Maricaulis sp.]|uniref:hypothetical protein n=1 Tax=unclassified Maricaulis TaxID=2632371 RepID=UPI001B026483|nr:hypothetical protein [Maricaulis sp.]MBO6798383.1 hypothetical protein [Maricaulis sp.]